MINEFKCPHLKKENEKKRGGGEALQKKATPITVAEGIQHTSPAYVYIYLERLC